MIRTRLAKKLPEMRTWGSRTTPTAGCPPPRPCCKSYVRARAWARNMPFHSWHMDLFSGGDEAEESEAGGVDEAADSEGDEPLRAEAATAPEPIKCRKCGGPPAGEFPFKSTQARSAHERTCDGIWRDKKLRARLRQERKRERDAPPDTGIVAGARALGAIAVDAVRRRVGGGSTS